MTTIASFSGNFTQVPFASGGASSISVPSLYHVGIDGHPFMLDLRHDDKPSSAWFKTESVPLLRDQADTSKLPSEQSLNPAGFWRRAQESWHHGAGQTYLDRGDSDDFMYYSSKGINPWTKWTASLLNSTSRTKVLASSTNGPSLASTGNDLYATDGAATMYYSADGTTWANVTGIPAANCAGLATNGSTVYSAWAASGVYSTVAPATTAAVLATGTANTIAYVLGRLITSDGANLRNYISGGALPAAFYTHPEANWSWTAFAGGQGFIYAAGAAGARSAVYRITIQPDGTALTTPVQALMLPAGEVVRSMIGYFGLVMLGTDKGVRLCTQQTNGDLTMGALISTASAVRAFETGSQYIWFGWSNYDGVSTGLGRTDLTAISDAQVPAYASDLMATSQGTVQAIATIDGLLAFAVAGDGVYLEQTTTPVTSGTLVSGKITYGISDLKTALFVDLKHDPLPTGTSIAVAVAVDGGTPTNLGSSSGAGSTVPPSPIQVGQKRGEMFELTLTLTGSGANKPSLGRWVLRSFPAPGMTREWTLPLLLHERLTTRNGSAHFLDVQTERDYLISVAKTRQVVALQLGNQNYQAIITDLIDLPYAETKSKQSYQGLFVVSLREVT